MRHLALVLLLVFVSCASKEREREDVREVEQVTTIRKGTEGGQPVDVTEKTQRETITQREAAKERETTPNVPAPGIADIVGGLLTGNWSTVIAALSALLVGKVAGRKSAEGELAEVTKGVDDFVRADPAAGSSLLDSLSRAMSTKTKKTVRRIKP